ncbi:MAG: hypothetical protein H0W33_00880 [Gammaproteobacteria bacterium]|nr:hypothetical protein [Gammaproteobacteria bacterium]
MAGSAFATGHGPTFTLATPTLADGQFSSDTMLMTLTNENDTAFMTREIIGYGVTEDFQLNFAFPLSPVIDKLQDPPRTRMNALMGGFGDVEASAMWRFHSNAFDIGKRFESTLLLGGSLPTDERRGGVGVGPSLNIAAVTGYVSRDWYAWGGAGFQYYFEHDGDRLGELPYLTAAVAYRPAFFREAGRPDIRVFVESIAEFPRRDVVDGTDNADSGGEQVLVGPSILALKGPFGLSAGALFPVQQDFDGDRAEEDFRFNFTFTYWF